MKRKTHKINFLKIPKEEQWLLDPKNKPLVKKLKKALKQKADRDIDLDALSTEMSQGNSVSSTSIHSETTREAKARFRKRLKALEALAKQAQELDMGY